MAGKREAAQAVSVTLPTGTKVTVGKDQAAKYETKTPAKKATSSKTEK